MALRNAVELILKNMKETRDMEVSSLGYSNLSTYVAMLEMALLASEGKSSELQTAAPILSHRDLIEREKMKLRMSKEKVAVEEDLDTNMLLAVGGELDGSMVPITGNLQEGGTITIGGNTYKKGMDGCLHVMP